jgi:hypothetical protein
MATNRPTIDCQGYKSSEGLIIEAVLPKGFTIAVCECHVLPVNASNNLWVADFISRFIGYIPGVITLAYYTSNLLSHNQYLLLV